MTSTTLKKLTSENISMIGNIVSSLYTRKSTAEDIKKSYAILILADKTLRGAYDIEEVYNARKLFGYAFSSNNMDSFIQENPFLKLAKRNFEETYRTKNLIKRGVLNVTHKTSLQHHLQDVLVRMKNSAMEDIVIDEYVDFVEDSADSFLKVARNL